MSKGVTPHDASYGWVAVHPMHNQNHATTFLRVTPKEDSISYKCTDRFSEYPRKTISAIMHCC